MASKSPSDKADIVEEKYKMPSGEMGVRRWRKGRVLGKGGFATCYEFTNLDNNVTWACKLVCKASLTANRAKQKLMSEIKIHRTLKHQNICQFHSFFDDNENIYIMLELCANETLHEMLTRRKKLEEIEVQCLAKQIIGMLMFIRSKRIIHRDLKLGNLLLSH